MASDTAETDDPEELPRNIVDWQPEHHEPHHAGLLSGAGIAAVAAGVAIVAIGALVIWAVLLDQTDENDLA